MEVSEQIQWDNRHFLFPGATPLKAEVASVSPYHGVAPKGDCPYCDATRTRQAERVKRHRGKDKADDAR